MSSLSDLKQALPISQLSKPAPERVGGFPRVTPQHCSPFCASPPLPLVPRPRQAPQTGTPALPLTCSTTLSLLLDLSEPQSSHPRTENYSPTTPEAERIKWVQCDPCHVASTGQALSLPHSPRSRCAPRARAGPHHHPPSTRPEPSTFWLSSKRRGAL